jgi:hypothetical protein
MDKSLSGWAENDLEKVNKAVIPRSFTNTVQEDIQDCKQQDTISKVSIENNIFYPDLLQSFNNNHTYED